MLLQLFVVLLASILVKCSAINANILTDEKTKEVSLTTCNDNACDSVCKIFGYKDGSCSNDQCKCSYYERAKYHTKEINDCDDLLCYLTCGGSGFCVGDFCYCYTFKPLKELKPKASYSLADSCNFQECDQLCRNLGFPGGACVGDRCDCDNFKPLQDEKTKEVSLTTWDDIACKVICNRLGYKDGLCSNDQCLCFNYERAKYHTQEMRSLNDCDYFSCLMTCFGNGFIGGYCSGGSCYCYTFKPLRPKELKPKASYSLTDSCDFQACDQLCRNLGFPSGACVGDRCECDNFKPLQEFLHLITPMKSIERENSGKPHKIMKDIDDRKKTVPCDVDACNDFCHRSNYIGGVCLDGSCSCY